MSDKNQIDDLFKNTLENYEVQPLESSWKTLTGLLDNEEALKYKKKYRLAKEIILVLMLFIMGSFTYFYFINKGNTLISNNKLQNNSAKIPLQINAGIPNSSLNLSVPKILISANEQKAKNKVSYNHNKTLKENGHLLAYTNVAFPGNNDAKENTTGIQNINFIENIDYIKPFQNASLDVTEPKGFTPLIISENNVNPGHLVIPKTQRAKPFFTIGFSSTLKHTFNNIIDNSPYNGINEEQEIKLLEKNKICYNIGISAELHFNNHWAIESGIYYSSTIIDLGHQEIYGVRLRNGKIGYKLNSSSGFTYLKTKSDQGAPILDSINLKKGNEELAYVKLPLLVDFTFQKGKWRLTPSVGLSFNFLVGMSLKAEIDHGSVLETISLNKLRGEKKYYTGLMSNLNMGYVLNNKLTLNLIPTYTYSISPVTDNNLFKTYTQNLGLGAGLTYRF